jgi:sarcosine oxidase subunit gamma
VLLPGPHGAAGLPGVTLAERRTTLHQVSSRRGAAIGLPPPGRALPMWGGVALGIMPTTALLVDAARPDVPGAAVIDQSGGFVVLRLAGPAAAEVLARGCRLDLHDNAFRPGSVARTPIAQVPVILHRAEGFALFVPATLARSFVHFLLGAAAGFGCAILPVERDLA